MAKQKLLMHICCAPCATHVFEILAQVFDITGFFFNPNIHPPREYALRLAEARRYCEYASIPLISPPYEPRTWFSSVKGFEHTPEGGERCMRCYRMRMEETARSAAAHAVSRFGTTLTISPHKNADAINHIGEKLAVSYDITFHAADFKKNNGFRKSCELSKKHNLYRQSYCGCIYSRRNSAKRS
jgi:predicted adenine nucleotide alpha hydrolase (AANH) superfamily ATPase